MPRTTEPLPGTVTGKNVGLMAISAKSTTVVASAYTAALSVPVAPPPSICSENVAPPGGKPVMRKKSMSSFAVAMPPSIESPTVSETV